MNEQIKKIIFEFCQLNKVELLKYKIEGSHFTSWDYLSLIIDPDIGLRLENHPLMLELVDKVFEFLIPNEKELLIDLGDHETVYNGKTIYEVSQDDSINHQLTLENIKLNNAFKIKVSAFNILYFNTESMFFTLIDNRYFKTETEIKCERCDKFIYVKIDCKDQKIKITNDEEGFKCSTLKVKIKFDFDVPSKRIVFLENFEFLVEIKREDKYKHSISSSYGRIKECEAYLERKSPCFILKNKYLSFGKNKENKYVISNLEFIEDNVLCLGGNICLFDFENFQKEKQKKYEEFSVADVEKELGQPLIIDLSSNVVEIEYDAVNETIKINEK